jgi:hypothetical protein
MTILPWNHAVAEIPGGAREIQKQATAEECAAIARDLGLLACENLAAAYTIRPLGGGRYKVQGTTAAAVTQACIVTLEPVAARLQLPFDVEFSPEPGEARPPREIADGDNEAEVLSLPEIEKIEHGILDVGRVVFEVLAAGLNPYPKKPDAAFEWQDPLAKDAPANPFGVLAQLKPKS